MSELTTCQQENESCDYRTLRAENARLKAELRAAEEKQGFCFACGNLITDPCEVTKLKAELAAAKKDAERLDFIIEKALESRTGVTLDYHKYVEDGQVVERGFRMAWFHHLNPRFKTLREAIDEAILLDLGVKK